MKKLLMLVSVLLFSQNLFSQVTLQSPNGGEIWKIDSQQNITWTSLSTTNVKIELSTDNGIVWSLILDNYPASSGSYPWTVRSIPSTMCKIKISDAANNFIFDESDAVFTIEISPLGGGVTLLSPNGGEVWLAGSTQTVSWTDANPTGFVNLDYSSDNGGTWNRFVNSANSMYPTYQWGVPSLTGTFYKVRVTDVNNSLFSDESDAPFTITDKLPSTITLTYPIGGEIFYNGSQQTITWTSSNVGAVNLHFSPDNGVTWNSIASSLPAYMGSYSSIVTSTPTTTALIRISDAADATTFDESDGVFTILDTTTYKITLSLPNGGENWQVGSNQYLAWTNTNMTGSVNIDYSTDNGTTWFAVATNISSMYPTFMWTVPNTPSTACKIKVYDASDASVFDESDAVFTIQQLEQFTEQTSISLIGLGLSSVAWGDYDNDGYLDILLTGRNDASHPFTIIYKNNGDGTFTEQTNATLTSASSGSAAWGDYDNDGYLDILLTGYTLSGPVSQIYKNNGDGTFTLLTSVSLPGVGNSSVAWGDYDNDGKLDILLTGNSFGTRISKIYKNNGNGIFTEQTSVSLKGVSNSSVAWGDYDNDGNLDILLTGLNDLSGQVSIIYKNNGDGTFTEQTSVFLAGVEQGSVAWGDYDNDGYLDILLTGMNGTNQISKIYKNNWDGTFTEQTSASLTGVSNSSVAWGDYNNDGLLDILLTGYEMNNNPISKIYKNMGEGNFYEQTSASLIGVANSSAVWGDYDNDGALDILLTGYTTGSGYVSKIYKNINAVFNTASTAPTNLTSSVSGNDVSFNWNKSYDQETPQNGLSYNLLIGTTLESVDVLSPMANKTNGFRRIVKFGNNQTNSWTIKNLPGGTYLWSVQAIDAAFTGSPFASQEVFTVGGITNTLLLLSPNGGENLVSGTVDTIHWSANYLTQVKLDYTTDYGTTWTNIVGSMPAEYPSGYAWVVPNTPSTMCKVRVTDINNNGIFDESDGLFTISGNSLQTGLVAYYPFNGNANDESGNGLNGTNNGATPTTDRFGNAGKAYAFDGISSYIDIGDQGDINDFTISIWFNCLDNSKTPFLVGAGNSNNEILDLRVENTGTLHYLVSRFTANSQEGYLDFQVPLQRWNHAVITRVGGTVKLYFNGQTGTIVLTMNEGSLDGAINLHKSLVIGANNYLPNKTDFFPGSLDDIRIYNRALTQAEINLLFNEIPQQTSNLTVASPNGGENLVTGTVDTIHWSANYLTQVQLDYSTDYGDTWINIVGSMPADYPSGYAWLVPNTPSQGCKIRVTDINNNGIFDESDGIFSIQLFKSGEYLPDANTVMLDHFNGTTDASILAYTQTGQTCGSELPPATPSFYFSQGLNEFYQALTLNPPIETAQGSATYLKYPGGQLLSRSNGTIEFWIRLSSYGKGLSFVNQGQFYGACSGWTFNLDMDSTGMLNSSAWAAFSLNSGSNKVPIGRWTHVAVSWGSMGAKLYIDGNLVGSDANTGMPADGYGGNVLITLGTGAGVSSAIDELRISDIQRTEFNIIPQQVLTLATPNGGEYFIAGMVDTIRWTSSNATTLNIDYSTDNGATWMNIYSAMPAGIGSTPWLIPNTPSINCKVRIVDANNANMLDESDGLFTIEYYNNSQITLASPNGGEYFVSGTVDTIRWSATSTTQIKIDYTTDNGATWLNIAGGVSSMYPVYIWTVPNTPSTTCKVRVTDNNNPTTFDESDGLFTITSLRHFTPIWYGNPYQAMNIFVQYAALNGEGLFPDDEIGIFDGENCVGAITLNGGMEIKASADDPLTEGIDGFNSGASITYRLWKANIGKEITKVVVTYTPAEPVPVFEPIGTAFVYLAFDENTTQAVQIPANTWYLASLYVHPIDNSMQTVVDPILPNLVKMQDEAGNAVVKFPDGNWYFGIHDWRLSEGYYLYVNAASELSVTGRLVSLPFTIPLMKKWNIIGYPKEFEEDAITAVDSLIQRNILVKVQDYQGNSIVQFPTGGWNNSIGTLKPGQGYYVNVTENNHLTFNNQNYEIKGAKKSPAKKSLPKYFATNESTNSYMAMTIFVLGLDETVKEIAALNSEGKIEGIGVAKTDSSLGGRYCEIVIGKDNPLTAIKDGMKEGEAITLKGWSGEIEVKLTTQLVSGGMVFSSLGTTFTEFKKITDVNEGEVVSDYLLIRNYPNPFNPSTTIQVNVPKDEMITITLFNTLGEEVEKLVTNEMKHRGSYTYVWNANGKPSGVYFCELKTPSQKLYTKMLLTK
ncbi:MAG: FG-GAP-like repeat-containing protein [Ignavibacteriaceae bacterium]|nr:FG-GAP-like repeat-containing protein [Ignavibacteriaceae bacterium]